MRLSSNRLEAIHMKKAEIISSLKWYFSPYLTTLITAPMFIVILAWGSYYIWLGIWLVLFGDLYPAILRILTSPIVFVGLLIAWLAFTGIPKIWHRDWPAILRLSTILAAFVGTNVLEYILDGIGGLIKIWVAG